MTSDYEEFLSEILSITILSQVLRKSKYFPFLMFSAKNGTYWYTVYNVFGMTPSLTGDFYLGPRALKSSTRLLRRQYPLI